MPHLGTGTQEWRVTPVNLFMKSHFGKCLRSISVQDLFDRDIWFRDFDIAVLFLLFGEWLLLNAK